MKKILITGGSGFIGTNLISKLKADHEILNIDIKRPVDLTQNSFWVNCDILKKDNLIVQFMKFQPNIVVHLAARADVEGTTLDDYITNTEGTKNVLEAVKNVPSVERVVITSTQFVNQYHGIPKYDEDYTPYTIYGESKVITEKLTRNANLACCWTIVRPTNIWGPWHWRYPQEFWKIIATNKYFHPKGKKVTRSYCYVGNVAWQILRIIELPEALVHKQVFYLGDKPNDILDWVNGFSMMQIGKKVRMVPSWFVRSIALFGDILKLMNINFPITSSRYRSMTTSNEAPMEKTFEVLGNPPYNLAQGISETIAWMKQFYPHLIKVPN